jgi:hypothetical protein
MSDLGVGYAEGKMTHLPWRDNRLFRLPSLTSKVFTEVPATGFMTTAATIRARLGASIDGPGRGLDEWKDGSNQF